MSKLQHKFSFSLNFEFCFLFSQVVDMRWGVRDEATDDHMTTELCMREIVRKLYDFVASQVENLNLVLHRLIANG